MPKPLAVLSADTHLSDKSWANREICGDSYVSFAQLVDAALKYNVPLVLAGDIFDSHVNRSRAVTFAYEHLDRLHAAGLSCFAINGNHDQSDPPWLSAHPAFVHLHLRTVKLGTIDLWGLDYAPAPLLQVGLAQAPDGVDLAVCHQPWSEFRKGGGGSHGSFADVCKATCLFTGDLHEYRLLQAVNRDGRPMTVVSPGSTCLTSIDEAEDTKTASVLMDDFTWRRLRLKTRRRITWDFAEERDVDSHLKGLDLELAAVEKETVGHSPQVRRPLLWVRYPWHLAGERGRVEKAVGDRAWLFWRESPPEESRPAGTAVSVGGAGEAVTLASGLGPYLEAHPDLAGAGDDCRRLLAAADPAAELEAMYAEV